MCCFSGPVRSVAGTKIFARLDGGRQHIVYEMSVQTEEPVAMVLPIPVIERCPEDAVEFCDLSGHTSFFADLDTAFPRMNIDSLGISRGAVPMAAPAALKVERVGDFEASFVPTIADFSRLDPRFQLAPGVWDALPLYKDYGFAVFQLRAGNLSVHPMAFSFPTRALDQVFFPTVHVHDGSVTDRAHFDHALYTQWRFPKSGDLSKVRVSELTAGEVMDNPASRGVVATDLHVSRWYLRGNIENRDVWTDLQSPASWWLKHVHVE